MEETWRGKDWVGFDSVYMLCVLQVTKLGASVSLSTK